MIKIFPKAMPIVSDAKFNDTRTHRYILIRIWDDKKPKLMIIGLNPSIANEKTNDNTINKVIKIAKNKGFGGVYMANLFSYITPHPASLIVGSNNRKNDSFLKKYEAKSEKVVFAWGNFKEAQERAKEVIAIFPKAYCFFKNKNGSPKHPLYCKDNQQIIVF